MKIITKYLDLGVKDGDRAGWRRVFLDFGIWLYIPTVCPLIVGNPGPS